MSRASMTGIDLLSGEANTRRSQRFSPAGFCALRIADYLVCGVEGSNNPFRASHRSPSRGLREALMGLFSASHNKESKMEMETVTRMGVQLQPYSPALLLEKYARGDEATP